MAEGRLWYVPNACKIAVNKLGCTVDKGATEGVKEELGAVVGWTTFVTDGLLGIAAWVGGVLLTFDVVSCYCGEVAERSLAEQYLSSTNGLVDISVWFLNMNL